jgi:uroporphyrinogen-III decarboxylase
MDNHQWDVLTKTIKKEKTEKPPIGFIIDSPWIPGWLGISTLDYFTNDNIWFEANKKAIETFPEAMFLPGFWSEYGMCTEPSAFGSKLVWETDRPPHADKVFKSIEETRSINQPNVTKDGLLPFTINRLKINQNRIEDLGHSIKFAVARGPLNIASFLLGTTEFMMACKTHPEDTHHFIKTITSFVKDWLAFQIESFPSIDGILLLDDIIGFLGDKDFQEFVVPYLSELYQPFDVAIKFLHNDAHGLVTAPYLKQIGVNLFNFSFNHDMSAIKKLSGDSVALLGNIPPRDILALGTKEDVKNSVTSTLNALGDHSGIIMSCGGGMPMDVSSENINTFIEAVKEFHKPS